MDLLTLFLCQVHARNQKLIKEKKAPEKLPDLYDIKENLRNSKHYERFCTTMVKRAFGIAKWKEKSLEKPMRDFISVSFEAFVLVAYENVYEVYKDGIPDVKEAEPEVGVDGTKKRKPNHDFVYTNDARCSKRNGGWKSTAYVKMNEYLCRIRKDREENRKFDEAMLKKLARKTRAKQTEEESAIAQIVIQHDFGGNINWAEV